MGLTAKFSLKTEKLKILWCYLCSLTKFSPVTRADKRLALRSSDAGILGSFSAITRELCLRSGYPFLFRFISAGLIKSAIAVKFAGCPAEKPRQMKEA